MRRVTAQLRQAGARVQTARADLRTFDGVEHLYAAIDATERPIDAIALNAGVGQGGPFVETDLPDLQKALMAGKSKVLAGSLRTKMQDAVNRVLPDRAKASAHRRMAEPAGPVTTAGRISRCPQ